MKTAEKWWVIDEAPDYAVSSLGNVKRINPDRLGRSCRTLKPNIIRRYKAVILCLNPRQKITRKVHRLVCTAAHGSPPTPKHQAAHIDGNSLNNSADNLYWATYRENMTDSIRHGTFRLPELARPWKPGETNGNAKLTDQDVREILNSPRYIGSGKHLSEKYGVSMTIISGIRLNRIWRHIPRD